MTVHNHQRRGKSNSCAVHVPQEREEDENIMNADVGKRREIGIKAGRNNIKKIKLYHYGYMYCPFMLNMA